MKSNRKNICLLLLLTVCISIDIILKWNNVTNLKIEPNIENENNIIKENNEKNKSIEKVIIKKEKCDKSAFDCIKVDKEAQEKYKELLSKDGKKLNVSGWRDLYFEKYGFSFKIPQDWELNDPFISFQESNEWGGLGAYDYNDKDLDLNYQLEIKNSNIKEDIYFKNNFTDNYHKEQVNCVYKNSFKIKELFFSTLIVENKNGLSYNIYNFFEKNKYIYFIKLKIQPKYLKFAIDLNEQIINTFEWEQYENIEIENNKNIKFNDYNFKVSFNYPNNWEFVLDKGEGFYKGAAFSTIMPKDYKDKFSLEYDVNKTILSCESHSFEYCMDKFVPKKYIDNSYKISNFVRERIYKINKKPVAEKIYYNFDTKRYDLYYIIPHFKDYHTFHFNIAKDIFLDGQKIARELIESVGFKYNDRGKYRVTDWDKFVDGFVEPFEYLN